MPLPSDREKDIFSELLKEYAVREIHKNRPLLFQGEIPSMVFYLKSGVIKIYNITSQGEEKVVGYESAGGFLPLEWLFGHAPVSLYYCDTYTDCEVIRVSKPDLLSLLKDNPKASYDLLNRSVSMYIGATMHLHALEQSKVRQKLISILQFLVLRFGTKKTENKYHIELRLTHQEIANLLGATRETTSTELGKLSKEGVVKIENSEYLVDVDKAQRLLGEEDFRELVL